MGNFFNNGPTILKLIIRVRIYHIILIYIWGKHVELKTGFLRILFWTFIEVKQTIRRVNLIMIHVLFWKI